MKDSTKNGNGKNGGSKATADMNAAKMIAPYRIETGKGFRLKDYATANAIGNAIGKDKGEDLLKECSKKLNKKGW